MSMQDIELSYRRTAVEGASSVGLTIALYDTLAGDLKRAAQAQREGDIEQRCRELNHALIVVGFLESWIDPANGLELAKSLTAFYCYLRGKMMEGQLKQSASILEEQIQLVLDVRRTWHQIDQATADVTIEPAALSQPLSTPRKQRVSGNWSA